MTDRQTKAERKIATANELARRDTDTPWMTWRDIPLLILFSPFALLFGMHIAGFAMLIRKYFRVPYFVTLTLLYALLLIPLWIWYGRHMWILLAGSLLVLLSSLIPLLIDGREEAMNGSNFEHSAPAHIVLILVYSFIPAFDAAAEARSRLKERQNNPMQPSGEVGRFEVDDQFNSASRPSTPRPVR
ncbi:MAG: hypothetical protein AAGG48_09380 [Planctomycetota bacterium]